ncbi:hypothetical protein Drorol1_Dr00004349 [Drosera rotundifolia]
MHPVYHIKEQQHVWSCGVAPLSNNMLALLSGCSVGGLAVFLHCDNFTAFLPSTTVVKCLSDAGFFLDIRDISLNYFMRSIFNDVVSLQAGRDLRFISLSMSGCLVWGTLQLMVTKENSDFLPRDSQCKEVAVAGMMNHLRSLCIVV